jgi:phosphatidylglycerol:prolipoprotein diacylglycerol transferase
MHPVLFTIPGLDFPVRSFGVMLAIAFLVGAHMAARYSHRYGDDPEGDPARWSQVVVGILIGIVIGARLLYVVVEVLRTVGVEDPSHMVGQEFLDRPWKVLFVWEGGLVMYGGFAGAVIWGTRKARQLGMRPFAALDYGLVAGFLGQAIGRVGCLLVGDDYGHVVPEGLENLPFPLTITVPSAEWLQANPHSLFEPHLAGKTLWATQPWMSAKALIVFLVGLRMLRRRRYPGHVALWIALTYAVLRFAIEFFRGDEIRGVWFGLLSTSQILSIAAAALAVWLLYRNRARLEPMPGADRSRAPAMEGGAE